MPLICLYVFKKGKEGCLAWVEWFMFIHSTADLFTGLASILSFLSSFHFCQFLLLVFFKPFYYSHFDKATVLICVSLNGRSIYWAFTHDNLTSRPDHGGMDLNDSVTPTGTNEKAGKKCECSDLDRISGADEHRWRAPAAFINTKCVLFGGSWGSQNGLWEM